MQINFGSAQLAHHAIGFRYGDSSRCWLFLKNECNTLVAPGRLWLLSGNVEITRPRKKPQWGHSAADSLSLDATEVGEAGLAKRSKDVVPNCSWCRVGYTVWKIWCALCNLVCSFIPKVI